MSDLTRGVLNLLTAEMQVRHWGLLITITTKYDQAFLMTVGVDYSMRLPSYFLLACVVLL
jgi:hypothetical protein